MFPHRWKACSDHIHGPEEIGLQLRADEGKSVGSRSKFFDGADDSYDKDVRDVAYIYCRCQEGLAWGNMREQRTWSKDW